MKTNELTFFPTWTAGRKGYAERVREVFAEHLRKKNLFQTPQRLTILNHLLAADQHMTQDALYAALKPQGIGKVTVFRTLKLLEECGVVEPVSDQKGRAHYEVNMERPHHDRLVCVGCGGITEVQWPDIEKIQGKVCRQMGFEIVFHRHEVFGRCRQCRGAAA